MNYRVTIGAALIGVAAVNFTGWPLAGAAVATDLPPCTSKVIVNCSPVNVKATVPRGYKIPKIPRGY